MKKVLKRSLSFLLAIALIFSSAYVGLSEVDFGSLFAVRAEAASSGTCGDNLAWTLDDEGTLTISGTGDMTDYSNSSSVPWYSVKSSIKSLVVDSGVSSIGDYAFKSCENLVAITIPFGVSSIGESAFYGCENLESVLIPDSVTELGDSAFCYCRALSSLTLSTGLTELGVDVFGGCDSLISVIIPEGVKNIGKSTVLLPSGGGPFSSCENLVSVTIPESVENIYETSFSGCGNLAYIFYAGTQEQWESISVSGVDFELCFESAVVHYEATDHTYGDYTYDYSTNTKTRECIVCGNSTSVELSSVDSLTFTLDSFNKSYVVSDCDTSASGVIDIPSTYDGLPVTEIGQSAFVDCTEVTGVSIPDSVYRIGFNAFNGAGIESVTIPGSVEVIYQDAFSNCSQLKSVVVKEGVKYIYGASFVNCENLTSIQLPDSIISIFENEFTGSAYYNDNANWEDGVLYVSNHLIKADASLSGNYTVKEGTKTIADNAFYGCVNLESVTLPEGINSIGRYAFYGCSSLKNIELPEGMEMLGESVFAECTALESVAIGDGITFIWNNVFDNTAFYNNSANWQDDVLYVGNYLITAKTTLSGSYIINEGTKVIASQAFLLCKSLEDIDIPNSVISIGHNAFYNTGIHNNTSNWNDGVLYIDDCLIDSNDSFSGECIVEDGTRIIASAAFYLSNITSLVLPCSVENIGWFAFEYSTLEKISLYNTVKNIDYRAFFYCFGIDTISFCGTEAEWEAIQIKEGNLPLETTDITFVVCEHNYGDIILDYDTNTQTRECSDCGYILEENISIEDILTFTLSDDGAYYIVTDCNTSVSGKLVIPDTYNGLPVTSIGASAFADCKTLTEITIPSGITNIGDSAFFSSGLTYLEIPDSVTSLGDGIFYSCYSLESVKLPNTITSIPYETFCNSGIKSIVIPENVTTISERAFAYCDGIESITIPINVYDIEYDAFFYAKVKNVFYKGTEARWGSLRIDNGNTPLTSAKIHFGVTGHTASDWVVSTVATCTQEGVKTGYCSVCGEACSTVIPKLEHSYDYDNYEYVTNPENESECVKQHKCIYCDATILGEEVYIPIRTVDDLRNIDNKLTANYILVNDIDLTEATAEDGIYDFMGNGWEPIGSNGTYGIGSDTDFSGIFDGNGYEIKGLRIDVTSVPENTSVLSLGLFSRVSGTVENLYVYGSISSNVKVEGYVGAIAGYVQDGTIKNCHSSCNTIVSNSYAYKVGGIVGKAYNYNSCDEFVIECCSNTGKINADLCTAGGIVGYAADGGTISYCFNSGDIVTNHSVNGGGIVGYWTLERNHYNDVLTISNCYNAGDVSCGIGHYSNYDTYSTILNIIDCYNIGTALSYPIIYSDYGHSCTHESCYAISGSKYSETGVTIFSQAEMQEQASYAGFDFDNIWFIDASNGYPYPQLRNNPHKVVVCQHTYGDWVVDTIATCTKDGTKHRTCSSCGNIENETITATGHNYGELIVEREASCTGDGFGYRTCINYSYGTASEYCEYRQDEVIPKTGHDYSTEWTVDVAATCTENGSKSHHCLNCDDMVDVTEIVAPGHIVGEWVVTTEPTCSQEGEKTGYCGECGSECATEAVATLEHNYDENDYEYVQSPENPNEFHKQYECEDCGSTKLDETPFILKAIIIESLPDNTSYIEGQEIDTTGLVVKAEFEDGTTTYITDYEISYDNSVAGEQEVTVSFGDASATFTVTFAAKTLVSIAVTKMPDKTTYVAGDSFDKTGMVVTATYDNGLSEDVTDFTVSTLPKTAGTKNLIVTYSGKRVIIQVNVIEKKAVSMTVVDPEKFEYVLGDEFDPTGMVVTVTFNNGAVEEVTDYTIEGFGEFTGVGYVTLKYDDLTYDLIVLMHAPADSWIIETQATCTEDGVKHLYCTECGEIAKTEAILATGHDYAETVIKESNCITEGEKYRECNVCGISDTVVIPALGHEYSTEYTVDIEPTCSQSGSKSRHCIRCDAKTDVTVIESSGSHNYNDWVVTTPATCETDGERTRSCSSCGESFVEIIEAQGHVFSIIWTTDITPTCTVDGSKSHHCNRCDAKTEVTVIPALGHSYGEWIPLDTPSCTANGKRVRICSTCGTEDIEEIPALGHSYSEWIIDSVADCENDGARHAVCGVCLYVNNEIVKAYGHDYESVFTVDKEATCTESGLKSHHCSRCDSKSDETAILALGHHISTMWTIDAEPTCASEGVKSHHCLRCDIKTDETVIPVASHIYGKWYVVTPATMDEAGVRAHKCYNCEMAEEAELPKLLKYTATFVADGDVVATVDFPEDATEIEIPEVPHKDKFNGEWENFTVRNKNFTVNAVYTPISTEQIDGITAGNTADYYSSTGEVEINLNVSAPSKTIVTTTTKAVPLDIIFVLDQSGSMADGGKKNALKNAVASFSNEILADAIANSVDHRIAVVGFASGNNDNLNYGNTELLTSKTVKYNKITDADYKDALVSVNNEGALNSVISSAINNIDAEGATKADLGLEMASNIFANNPIEDNRQRVVVFLTDGVPTKYSNFEYSVANVAIQNAYQIKNTYDATVYSVGVFDRDTSSNRSVNNFMNYVSSNYNEEVVMSIYSKETTENINGYYLDVSDVSTLSDVFTSIVEETTTHTGRFSNATLKYTLTKYFTLTSVQEDAIRKSAIEALGVTNEQITITRNADSTTTIVITGVEPWAEGEEFVIDFTFRATANENTLKSGTYQVGTFESGVILENGEGYEAVFAPNSVDIGGTSGIAVFNINNIPYAINRLSSTTKVVAPATDFGADHNFIGWNVPGNLTLNNEVRVFEAELLKNEYKISWNIDGEITEVKYAVGDFIAIPEVGNNSIGGAFVGWDKEIPETMPSENLTITAVYDAHYHKYDVTKDFELCTEGGTLTYICDCGDTYTEEIAPCEHSWEVITASNNQKAIENAGSRCTVCGIKDSKALRLEATATYQMADASYNTATVELDYVDENGDKYQPDGDIEISVQLDEVFEQNIPEDVTASVYRVNDDGSRTKLESEQNGMNMTFTTDHFSTYEFEFTTGEQKYLFAQKGTSIDYENKIIFSDTPLAKEFKSLVTYLKPAKLDSSTNKYGIFGTGTEINLTKDSATDNYKVIINGDLNGDGVCDVLDASYAALVSSGHKTATQDEIYAANGDIADEIDVYDYQAIVNRAVS